MKNILIVILFTLCSLHPLAAQSSGTGKPKDDPQRPDLGIFDLKVTAIDGYPENKTTSTMQPYRFKYSATIINYGEKKARATNFTIKLDIMNGKEVLKFNKTHSISSLGPSEKKQISGSFVFSGTWLYWYELKGAVKLVTGELNSSNNTKTIEKVLRVN
jgi:hypothetical protein